MLLYTGRRGDYRKSAELVGSALIKMRGGMKVLYFRWVNIRMSAGLLWWAIKLPHARFVPHLLGFCRAIIEDAESRNPAIKADHEARREHPTTH